MLFHKDVSHIHIRMSNVKIGKVLRSIDCFNQTPLCRSSPNYISPPIIS